MWDGRGTEVEGALKEKRMVCEYCEKLKMKKQNEGQPIQLARKEQKMIYNKIFYENNKEKKRVCNQKYYEKLKIKKQNEGQPIQLARKEQRRVYDKTYC